MRSPGVITRIVLVVVAIVIGKFFWPHVAPLSDRALFWMAIAAEGVLAAYLVAIVVGLFGPRWRGGDQAMGRGCAVFIAAGFVLVGAVLGMGWPCTSAGSSPRSPASCYSPPCSSSAG